MAAANDTRLKASIDVWGGSDSTAAQVLAALERQILPWLRANPNATLGELKRYGGFCCSVGGSVDGKQLGASLWVMEEASHG